MLAEDWGGACEGTLLNPTNRCRANMAYMQPADRYPLGIGTLLNPHLPMNNARPLSLSRLDRRRCLAAKIQREFLTTCWSESTYHRDDFSRPALRYGSLNALFQVA